MNTAKLAGPPDLLLETLRSAIPDAELVVTELPQCRQISLWLLNADYPQWSLSYDQAQRIMADPPYWSFCWASGQVLAAYILQNPELVKGRQVVDLGAGSGVVAIACKMAGASRAIACDYDPLALQACRANADLNGVELEVANNHEALDSHDLLTVADVFYDRDNLPLLAGLRQQFNTLWVADSRLRGQPLEGLRIAHRASSYTVPDLDESSEFNSVCLYTSCR